MISENKNSKTFKNKFSFKKIVVLGPGPIIIGQGAEFDYSGSQCLETLKKNNIYSVVINSNPATIMTDSYMADKIYMEPMHYDFICKILLKEKPDALIGSFGGQTALNLTKQLGESGFLQKHKITLLGSSIESIKVAEDRQLFRDKMNELNIPVPISKSITNLNDAKLFAKEIGFPLVVRTAFTLGGSGGGIVYNEEDLNYLIEKAINTGPVKSCLLEQSILGLKEIEFEIMRDHNGNCISVCGMENIDPVGVHTGDSIVVTPILTLSDQQVQLLRTVSLKIAHEIGIIGGCNVQLAIDPSTSQYYVIEINPRVSRSSALASKATGYPIAKIATQICLGFSLSEIINPITGKTYASHEPALDYIVVKIPRWPFDKFHSADRSLGTQMKATGEVMSIGRNFEEAFLKGFRSLELDLQDLYDEKYQSYSAFELIGLIQKPTDERMWQIAACFRKEVTVEEIYLATKIDKFFLRKIQRLIDLEKTIAIPQNLDSIEYLSQIKEFGFSNMTISRISNLSISQIENKIKNFNLTLKCKKVDTCSAEFEAETPYFYTTYEPGGDDFTPLNSQSKKIVILGPGPIRIGQGIEFDYVAVHALNVCRNLDYKTIIINNNPETCSTDYTYSDRLYFSPLDEEEVNLILTKEQPDGVLVQFGGQTALNLAESIEKRGFKIFGTTAKNISRVENRELFEIGINQIEIKRPKALTLTDRNELHLLSTSLHFPVIIRPSFVLGGRNMCVCHSIEDIENAIKPIAKISKDFPLLIDEFIKGKEIEVDILSDGENIFIPGIMEHIERAGIHSGDSIAVYPPYKLHQPIQQKILDISLALAREFQLIGIFNIQLTYKKGELYLLEVNPRSSRTVPFLSKMSKIPIAELATKICLGATLKDLSLVPNTIAPSPSWFSVKVPVFSFEKLQELDPALEAEMKSTGEVLGRDKSFEKALYKGLIAQGTNIPLSGTLLITVSDRYKQESLNLIKEFYNMGFEIMATAGTAKYISEHLNISCTTVSRISEISPNERIDVLMKNNSIDIIVNTLSKGKESNRDGFLMRRLATERKIPCFTSLETAYSFLEVLKYMTIQPFEENTLNL